MKSMLLLLPVFSFFAVAACEERPRTMGEKVEDKVKDGMDARPGEKVKDAGEDVKDKVKDATN